MNISVSNQLVSNAGPNLWKPIVEMHPNIRADASSYVVTVRFMPTQMSYLPCLFSKYGFQVLCRLLFDDVGPGT